MSKHHDNGAVFPTIVYGDSKAGENEMHANNITDIVSFGSDLCDVLGIEWEKDGKLDYRIRVEFLPSGRKMVINSATSRTFAEMVDELKGFMDSTSLEASGVKASEIKRLNPKMFAMMKETEVSNG